MKARPTRSRWEEEASGGADGASVPRPADCNIGDQQRTTAASSLVPRCILPMTSPVPPHATAAGMPSTGAGDGNSTVSFPQPALPAPPEGPRRRTMKVLCYNGEEPPEKNSVSLQGSIKYILILFQ